MQFEGTTYRPPMEADSMLLQVTVGCAHNRCAFCTMYRDVRFRVIDMEQIERDLIKARQIYPRAERVFLVNGDAFVLPAPRLIDIAGRINHHFPECTTITMYASVQNIQTKTDAQLHELKSCGINDLYIGIESGSEEVIQRLNKGHTVAEAKKELERLNTVGINHMTLLMLGVAGKGRGIESARLTASFVNETRPQMLWAGTLALFEGTELHQAVQRGEFIPQTEYEVLEEEKELLRNIRLNDVPFYGNHPTNLVKVYGILSRDAGRIIQSIDRAIEHHGKEALQTTFSRSSL
ncbi:MAG: radical SAM protein [Desulfobulbus sp.]|nr:radical SAM protein [Desulfobulbus sp.]